MSHLEPRGGRVGEPVEPHLSVDPVLDDLLDLFALWVEQTEGRDVRPAVAELLHVDHVKVLKSNKTFNEVGNGDSAEFLNIFESAGRKSKR